MTTLIKRRGDLFPSIFSDVFDTDRFFNTNLLEREFAASVPSVNISETDKEFKIELAAPGMQKNNFKVKVDDNILTISAESEEEKEEKKDRYTRREFAYNSFTRSFSLPEGVKSENIEGKYEDGILRLTVPKLEEARKKLSKEIKVA